MLGEVIKANRTKRNMTQEQLADRLCVTKATVSKWEVGNCTPDIEMLPRLGDVFGISMDDLLEYQPKKTVWVMELYDTGASALLQNFSPDRIPLIQKHIGEKEFLCIEQHQMNGNLCTECIIHWITRDEEFVFRADDRDACRKATVRLCEKGIYTHVSE
jgi:transcriptional regulator with XRE-family HTH domain